MDCRKRKHDLEEIMQKATEGKELDHCEELHYLVHVLHIEEEVAEQMLYNGNTETPPLKA
ncbi:MAG TPA: hypothetical protein PL009_13885 [Flavipsychrobacter sp.]|nr:hypothetical protein [Flavipsychrobacter sp.]